MDPTIEMPLPIFDQIESEWFRSSGARELLDPLPTPPSGVDEPGRGSAVAPAQRPAAQQTTVTGTPADRAGNISASGRAVPTTPSPSTATPSAPPAATPPVAPAASAASAQKAAENFGDRPTSRPADVRRPTERVTLGDRDRAAEIPTQSTTEVPPAPPVPTARPAAAQPVASTGQEGGGSWSSPADAGWRAAQAAAETKPDATTGTGLPKRVPMAHFVPGRVDQPSQRKAPRPTTQRSADAVRGVLSSYRHGLEQGRKATGAKHSVGADRENEQEEK
jgi:hypothetical protein